MFKAALLFLWYNLRAMKKKITLLLAACLLGSCSSPSAVSSAASSAETLESYSNLSYDAGFDTIYQYQETGPDKDAMRSRFDTGVEMFRQYNNLFDIYNDYPGINNLKTVNDNAGIQPVKVDPIIIDLIEKAKEFSELTGGAFDITIGTVLSVWHEYREEGIALNSGETPRPGPVPSEEEIREAMLHRGYEHVIIDEENSTVYIDDPAIRLDVGGIAKGYAAEQIARKIEGDVPYQALVNAGRNIRTIGNKVDGNPWLVGIVHPVNGASAAVISQYGSFSTVTSGDYERYYIGTDGKTYHHIVDPATGYPASYYHSVTIVTADSAAADCLSTALFVLSIEDGKKVLADYTAKTGDAADAVWIMDPDRTQSLSGVESDGQIIIWSEGLNDRIMFN